LEAHLNPNGVFDLMAFPGGMQFIADQAARFQPEIIGTATGPKFPYLRNVPADGG